MAVKTFWRLLPITIITIIGIKESSTPKNVEKLTKGVTNSNKIETDVNSTNKIDVEEICLKVDQSFSEMDWPRNLFIPTWISRLEILAKIAERVITNPKTPIRSTDVEFESKSKNKYDKIAGTNSAMKRPTIFLEIELNVLHYRFNT